MWQARNNRLKGSSVVAAISIGTQFTRALAEAAIPDFSLGALAQSGEETSLLHDSLVTTWDPGDEAGRAAVTAAYNGLNGTIAWAKRMLADESDNATGLLVRNYRACVDGKTADRISFAWAEYEYRRRCHYALELLLAALTNQLGEHSEASILHAVTEWSAVDALSPTLAKIWPSAAMAWRAAAVDVAASVPEDLFIDKALPTGDLRRLAAADQALAAFAILTATARQTKRLRQEGHLDCVFVLSLTRFNRVGTLFSKFNIIAKRSGQPVAVNQGGVIAVRCSFTARSRSEDRCWAARLERVCSRHFAHRAGRNGTVVAVAVPEGSVVFQLGAGCVFAILDTSRLG